MYDSVKIELIRDFMGVLVTGKTEDHIKNADASVETIFFPLQVINKGYFSEAQAIRRRE